MLEIVVKIVNASVQSDTFPQSQRYALVTLQSVSKTGTLFYRAMHFSAKRGIAIACRLSVRPSVCDVGEL